MSKKVNETLDFGSGSAKIVNLPAPTSAGDAVNKAYVDSLPSALTFIEKPARVASTGNVNIASPGSSIDSVALAAGDRVLLWQQTTPSQNGTYIWNGAATPMTRSTDTFVTGSVVFSTADGATNGTIGFILTTDDPVVGTTALTFIAAFRVITPGTGLTQTGNVVSLTVPVAVALGGTNATTTAGALAALGAARATDFDIGDGAASSFTLSTAKSVAKYPVVQVVNNSTGQVEDAGVTITPGAATGGVYTPSIVVTSEAWAASPPGVNAYHVTVVG